MTQKQYDSQSSKAEELEALTRLARVFKSGSYLYDFFTPDLLNWLAEQIKNDFVPDLMGYVKSAENEAREWHGKYITAELHHAEEVSTLELEQKTLNAEYLQSEKRLTYCQENAERQAKELDDFGTAYAEALQREQQLKLDAERLQAEIVRLKAKLYDLTENCGAA